MFHLYQFYLLVFRSGGANCRITKFVQNLNFRLKICKVECGSFEHFWLVWKMFSFCYVQMFYCLNFVIPLFFWTVGVDDVKKLGINLNSLYHEKERQRKVRTPLQQFLPWKWKDKLEKLYLTVFVDIFTNSLCISKCFEQLA